MPDPEASSNIDMAPAIGNFGIQRSIVSLWRYSR